MQHVYLHEYENMYKRLHVADPQPYLDDGWFLSIDDHLSHVAKIKAPVDVPLFPETKRKPSKKAK
jgi:hypothetical protein